MSCRLCLSEHSYQPRIGLPRLAPVGKTNLAACSCKPTHCCSIRAVHQCADAKESICLSTSEPASCLLCSSALQLLFWLGLPSSTSFAGPLQGTAPELPQLYEGLQREILRPKTELPQLTAVAARSAACSDRLQALNFVY